MDEAEKSSVAMTGKVSDLGRYRLIAELARGGMGVVYLALVRGPAGFNKLFVVKELKTHLAEDPSLVDMFLEEARLSAKLSHPNVVQTIEFGSEGDRHFMAMEYLDGQSLHRALVRQRKVGKPFPLPYFLHALALTLEGLHYVHELTDFDGTPLDLVHRDVSPHNVFVTYDGQVKLLDFGIAKAFDSSHDTRTGVLKGKVAYMAPEQAAGQAIDRRADVFSAGVMLFEAASGRRMWSQAQNDLQILHALMNGAVPRFRDAVPNADPTLARIVDRATSPRAAERYGSAADMQRDVEALAKDLGAEIGARDLGKMFGEAFAGERARLKQIVDAQLRTLRGMGSGEYGKIDLPQLGALSSATRSITPSGVHVGLPSSARADEAAPLSGARASHGPVAATAPPARTGRRAAPWVSTAIAAAVIAGGAAFVLHRTPAVAPSTTTGNAVTTPPAAPASIRVLVSASPREATITIDDGPAQTGTFRGALARDAKAHTIRVEAAKHAPETLAFLADDDHTFDVALEPTRDAPAAPIPAGRPPARRAAPPAPASPAPAVPAPSATPTPAPAPPPAAPPPSGHARQQIDTRDPYAP